MTFESMLVALGSHPDEAQKTSGRLLDNNWTTFEHMLVTFENQSGEIQKTSERVLNNNWKLLKTIGYCWKPFE